MSNHALKDASLRKIKVITGPWLSIHELVEDMEPDDAWLPLSAGMLGNNLIVLFRYRPRNSFKMVLFNGTDTCESLGTIDIEPDSAFALYNSLTEEIHPYEDSFITERAGATPTASRKTPKPEPARDEHTWAQWTEADFREWAKPLTDKGFRLAAGRQYYSNDDSGYCHNAILVDSCGRHYSITDYSDSALSPRWVRTQCARGDYWRGCYQFLSFIETFPGCRPNKSEMKALNLDEDGKQI